MTQQGNLPKPEVPKAEVDMSLIDKIHEFLEPILGDKLQYKPIFDGVITALLYGGLIATGTALGVTTLGGWDLSMAALIGSTISTVIGTAIFDIRFLKGKRTQHNVK
jgi:hypothetical protein